MPGGDPQQLPPPQAAADDIRDAAAEIVARPEFQEPPRSLYQRAIDYIVERIDDLFSVLAGGGRTAVAAWLILLLFLSGAAYLVLRGIRLDRRRRPLPPVEETEVDPRRPPASWDSDADAFEAAGDWRSALRCRYRALVARLARIGVIEEVPGRTAGEYRAVVVHALPAAAAPFTEATDLFERAWYGREPTGPQESSAFRHLAQRVEQGAMA